MYFEKAIVKTYYRNYKNKKVPYNQLHLGKAEDSKFNKDPEKPDEVAVVMYKDFKELLEKAKPTELNELKAKLNELQEEKLQLEQELQELKATNESLTSDVEKLKEEKFKLQEDLLKSEDKNEEIIQLQQQHKEEVAELNFKLNNEKDLNKELLLVRSDFLKQGAFKRLFKVEPESSKRIAKLKKLPENEVKTEAKDVEAEE